MDITKFIDGLAGWFSKEIAPIVARITALEARQPEKGLDGKDGRDGIDGKDADLELIKTLIQLELGPIEIFKDGVDGKDGADGKDADPEMIKSIIVEHIAQIPLPKDGIDGKSVEIDQVKALISEQVAEIPAPKDGKDGVSVDVDQVKQLVVEEVAKMPVPQNGKDADPEIIKAMVAEAIADIPAPKDGKDADLEVVKGFIQAEIRNIPLVETMSESEIKALATVAASEVIKNVDLPSDGKDGENGRDALDIEILPAIDETKSYPRGTYAQHRKGLFRSYQKTHGMKGWECLVAGVAEISIEQTGERTFAIKSVLSDGDISEQSFNTHSAIYKGVWTDGEVNEKGDLRTWGGNIWHCNEQTTDKPKEGSSAWTLAVKRGRDYIEPAKLPPKRNPDDPVKMS